MIPLLGILTETEKRTDNNECSLNCVLDPEILTDMDENYEMLHLWSWSALSYNEWREFAKKVQHSVLGDDDVLLFDWCMAIESAVDQEVVDKCLEKIVKKWLSIRGNSFATNML